MPAIVVKEIRPAKLKLEAVQEELQKAMAEAGAGMVADFRATTATWKHKVNFEVVTDIAGNEVSVLAGTDDEIYRYVDEGTRPHIIVPVRAKRLRFQPGYVAKTTPGVIGSQAGGSYGDEVLRRHVMHPGTEARRFSETIAKKWRIHFLRLVLAAVQRGIKRAGG